MWPDGSASRVVAASHEPRPRKSPRIAGAKRPMIIAGRKLSNLAGRRIDRKLEGGDRFAPATVIMEGARAASADATLRRVFAV